MGRTATTDDHSSSPTRGADLTVLERDELEWLRIEIVRARRDLDAARREIEAAALQHERLITTLGHDLRNPLAAIVAGVELLGDLLEPHAHVVVRIARSAERMRTIVGDIMDFAHGRFNSGLPAAVRSCDLSRTCLEVVEEMRQACGGRQIVCQLFGELTGTFDPDRVAQALSNLLANAIAYGSDPVTLIARGEANEAVITVHNRGEPIPAEAIPTLFEPFTRGVLDHERFATGLGLGLFIVKQIVHAHGGTIGVTSTATDGTTFTSRWPRHGVTGVAPARSARARSS